MSGTRKANIEGAAYFITLQLVAFIATSRVTAEAVRGYSIVKQ